MSKIPFAHDHFDLLYSELDGHDGRARWVSSMGSIDELDGELDSKLNRLDEWAWWWLMNRLCAKDIWEIKRKINIILKKLIILKLFNNKLYKIWYFYLTLYKEHSFLQDIIQYLVVLDGRNILKLTFHMKSKGRKWDWILLR